MKKELKTFVLIVSLFFPAYHPMKKLHTFFIVAIHNALFHKDCTTVEYQPKRYVDVYTKKIHTIRESAAEWEKRAAEINAKQAFLSLRYWTGRPFHSIQKEFTKLNKLGAQRITFVNLTTGLEAYVEGKQVSIAELAKNDGLSCEDFEAWFAPKFKKSNEWNGIVLHFTDFRY